MSLILFGAIFIIVVTGLMLILNTDITVLYVFVPCATFKLQKLKQSVSGADMG